MLNEHSIYSIQSMNNVTDLSREDSISFEEYVSQCRTFVVNNMSIEGISNMTDDPKTRHKRLISLIESFVNKHELNVDGYLTQVGTIDKQKLLDDVVDTVTGLGILKDAFENPDIDEIQINDYKTIFVVDKGVTKHLCDSKGQPLSFFNNDEVHTLFNKLVDDGTGSIPQFTDGYPIVNTKTARDQYRVSAVHYAANARDPDLGNKPITSMVIRKFRKVKLTMKDLIATDTLTDKMARFLELLGRADITMFCVGKTGSGKTTLLNIIGSTIPKNKRILLVQNPTEITFFERDSYNRNIRNAVHWEVRDSSSKDKDAIYTATMENLMSNTLRFTPEMTIIGEARTRGEFEQIKRSIQMGQPVMGTFHAFDTEEAIGRMATEVGGDIMEAKNLFANSVDIIVSQFRFLDGTRRVLEISEVLGLNEDGSVNVNKLFEFEQTGKITKNPKNALDHAVGQFRQINGISESLQKKFFRSSISKAEIQEFIDVDPTPSKEV